MVELVDTLVLEASARASEFESRLGHHITECSLVWLKAPGLGPGDREFESHFSDL